MKRHRTIMVGATMAAIFALSSGAPFIAGDFAIAQTSDNSPGAPIGSQSGGESPKPGIAGQGGDDATLEIAPQPGLRVPKPGVAEIPGDRTFRRDNENASIEQEVLAPRLRADTENGSGNIGSGGDSIRPHRRPYLGATVEYTTQCYLGMEEHGLEVLSIDPNGPAAQAGLRPRTGMTAVGAAGSTASTMLGPLNLLVMPLLEKGGSLGSGGDLIVAVDDRRVRSQGDLESALGRMKPGDTTYLTIIRPLGHGQHKTMRVAVRLGAADEPIANATVPAPSGSASSAR